MYIIDTLHIVVYVKQGHVMCKRVAVTIRLVLTSFFKFTVRFELAGKACVK